MTIDIKKSWFQANWNKPKRMNKVMKRYRRKTHNVYGILTTAEQYHLEIPQMFKDIIKDKYNFYNKQESKLRNIMNAYLEGEMTKDNFNQIIDNVYTGKRYFQHTRPKGHPKWVPLVIEPKEPEKKGFFSTIIDKLKS